MPAQPKDRVFILGNGPSLGEIDLARLGNEETFACNRIQKHPSYRSGKWCPTHFLQTDKSNDPNWSVNKEFHLRQGYHCIMADDICREGTVWFYGKVKVEPHFIRWSKAWWEWDNLDVIPECGHIDADRSKKADGKPPDRWHYPHICTMGGPISVAIQWVAFRMPWIENVYLLGCDLGYRPMSVNNFSEDYLPLTAYHDEAKASLRNRTLQLAHDIAEREAANYDLKIWNATPGGELESHQRAELDKVI